ncbi:hypothetical protein AVEN_25912-1 [Araneus ventricosus]|uniref:Uncharacterized protein n=1 Tax=Araneus ventricosus TaxID=182803 RepID=A0A4Y2UZV8_ARAVE|nr:hypothetical protein AVEN_25912-1 [Araneus ventricosus]
MLTASIAVRHVLCEPPVSAPCACLSLPDIISASFSPGKHAYALCGSLTSPALPQFSQDYGLPFRASPKLGSSSSVLPQVPLVYQMRMPSVRLSSVF